LKTAREVKVKKTRSTKSADSAVSTAKGFTFVDLFAGIGGFHMGMAANGGRCVFSNEWNKYAEKTYSEWTKCETFVPGDVRELIGQVKIPRADVLCAGFPCQPFSLAGVSKKNSLGRDHGFLDLEQGNLFFAICEIVRISEPLVLLLENVKNLKSHDKGRTWDRIHEELGVLGYEVFDDVIDASGWVPQHRERVFLVCFRKKSFSPSERESFAFPTVPKNGPILSSILEQSPDQKYMLSDNLWAYLQEYAERHRKRGNGFGFGLVGPEDVSRTLSARYHKDGSEILIKESGWRNPRRLTPSECALLMGFNKDFADLMGFEGEFPIIVSDTQAYRQFGNAVSPIVAMEIGAEIVKVLDTRAERLSKRTRRRAS
jgi:DNA (cytosine-5)-methyltransferase 1